MMNIRTDSVLAVLISIQFRIFQCTLKSEILKYSECINDVWCSGSMAMCISNTITRWRYYVLNVLPVGKGSQAHLDMVKYVI